MTIHRIETKDGKHLVDAVPAVFQVLEEDNLLEHMPEKDTDNIRFYKFVGRKPEQENEDEN